ncbi:MAG TPA: cupin domain-containing protein [Enhygromyxa sp.]|nr:cupin domain-containing protein [Enhygromyxa sp.]
MRRPTSPSMMLAMFVLGACTTAVVQSSASRTGSDDELPPRPVATAAATVVPLAEAPRALAPNNKASITHLARGANAYLGMLHMDPDAAVPTHRDPTEEYIHVLEGGGIMTIDGQTYEIGAGTTIYMPADAEVSFQNGPAPMRAIQVFAGPEPAAKYDSWKAEE